MIIKRFNKDSRWIIAGISVAILIFGFFKNLEMQEEKLVKQLNSSLNSIQGLLNTVSRKEYVNNKNFPTGLLEGGRTEIKNSYETINKLNQLDLKKKNLSRKLTAGVWLLKNSGELKLEKTLANLKNTEKEILWWLHFQEGIKDILVYNVDADLRSRSVREEKRDFIFRLYLAKGGLLKAVSHFEEASSVSGDKSRLNKLIIKAKSAIETTDLLVIATDKNKFSESDQLREKYIAQFRELKENIAVAAAQSYADNRFSNLVLKLNQLISDLPNVRK